MQMERLQDRVIQTMIIITEGLSSTFFTFGFIITTRPFVFEAKLKLKDYDKIYVF